MIGGGGGGGGGSKQNAGANCQGGGGGGGGSIVSVVLKASDLSATVSVTVGSANVRGWSHSGRQCRRQWRRWRAFGVWACSGIFSAAAAAPVVPPGSAVAAGAAVQALKGPVGTAPAAPEERDSSARHQPRLRHANPNVIGCGASSGSTAVLSNALGSPWGGAGGGAAQAVRRHGHVRVRWRVHQLRAPGGGAGGNVSSGNVEQAGGTSPGRSLRACWRCCRSQPRRVHEPNRPLHHRRRRGRRRRCQDHERRCWPGLERMAVVEVAAVPARPSMAGPGGAGGAGFAIIVSY